MKNAQPCPFCKSTNLRSTSQHAFIVCRNCGAEGPFKVDHPTTTEEEAIAVWNTRPTPDEMTAAIVLHTLEQ